jgi:folate-binding protein YgfZ
MDRSNLVPTIDHLSKFLVADDVALKVSDTAVLCVGGPRAQSLLGVRDLPDFHFMMRDGVVVSRNRTLGVEGYHLLVPASKSAEADGILGHGVAPAGFEAHEALRVEAGFPRWGADMDATLLPMEAGLESIAINYAKGCYIGQEVIQRVKTYSEPPRMLVQLEVADAAAGDKITKGAEEVGAVTSATRTLALGLVRKEHRAPGSDVTVAGKSARVRALPWQSRIIL